MPPDFIQVDISVDVEINPPTLSMSTSEPNISEIIGWKLEIFQWNDTRPIHHPATLLQTTSP